MIVWIFKDPRSGSTAFTNLVAKRLNRIDRFLGGYPKDIEVIKNISNPEDYVFSTHSYDFIEIMNSFDKPVKLIRCARKDKLERCISFLVAKHKSKRIRHEASSWNIMRNSDPLEYSNFIAGIEPTVFTKKEVYDFLQYHDEINQYWKNSVASYQNCTVFYEDLCTDMGVDLPILDLTSLSIATDALTIKLPYDKKQICLNYDMVARWVTEYSLENELCPGGGMVDTQR